MSTGTTTPLPAGAAQRTAAIEAMRGADPERGLELAMPMVGAGGDAALLFEVAKGLVRAGLAGVAVRVLRSMAGGREADAQLAALIAQIGRLPSGEIGAEILGQRLAERRALIADRSAASAAAMPTTIPTSVRAFRSAKGNLVLLRELPNDHVAFLLPFEDQVARAAAITLPALEANTSYGFLGLPSQALLHRVIAEHSPTGYVPTIDIIERDAELFAVWTAMLDDSSFFRLERAMCFVGPAAYEEYRRYLLGHPWRNPATNTLTIRRNGVAPPQFDEAFLAPIKARLAEAYRERVRIVQDRCRDRDVEHWRQRYASAGRGAPPLRLVGFTSRFSTVMQHVMTSLAAAFERRGCRLDVVVQPAPWAPGVDVQGTLAAVDYDGIVMVNHLRFEYGQAVPTNLPVVSWIQDYMEQLCSRKAADSIGPLDLVLAHSPDVLASLYGYPLDRCIGTNNLTDGELYSNEPLPDEELAPHRCDVSFVSHGSETPEELVDIIAANNGPSVRRYLLAVLERIRAELRAAEWMHGHGLVELMLNVERELGLPPLSPEQRRAHIFPQVVRIFDRVFRHQAIEWAARWAESRGRTLRLYGIGWDRHPTLGRYACGLVDGGRPLRALYQASKVSLQVNGHSSLHQRLLDGLAAGGFLLCRTNPADFVRPACARIARGITEAGLTTLAELVARRAVDPELDAACTEAERLIGLVIKPLGDPRRDAMVRATRAGNNIADLCTDEGVFGILRDLRLMPPRAAAELPNFAATCFGSESALHALLDRYVDDEPARRAVAGPMRDSVMAHDTYDGMVDRILVAFGARPRSEA